MSAPVRLPMLLEAPPPRRPELRGMCAGGTIACGWISCKAHRFWLTHDLSDAARMTDDEIVDELLSYGARESCVYDIADDVRDSGEELSEEDLARLLGVTQPAVSQQLATRRRGLAREILLRAPELANGATSMPEEKPARKAGPGIPPDSDSGQLAINFDEAV
jgi:hypothetical protein